MADVIKKKSGDGWDTPLEGLMIMSLGGLFIGTLREKEIGEDRRAAGGENWRLKLRERTSPGLNSTELQPTETDEGI